jgi:hypothetical protein
MYGMSTQNSAPIEAVILAAGMTCYAEECDVIVVRRAPPHPLDPLVTATENVPPFPGD